MRKEGCHTGCLGGRAHCNPQSFNQIDNATQWLLGGDLGDLGLQERSGHPGTQSKECGRDS